MAMVLLPFVLLLVADELDVVNNESNKLRFLRQLRPQNAHPRLLQVVEPLVLQELGQLLSRWRSWFARSIDGAAP
jgi:hypothetical protein